MDYLDDNELLSFNFISAACAFISLINITLLLFYTFFASHGIYVINRFEDYNNINNNNDDVEHHDDEKENSDRVRRATEKLNKQENEEVKECPESQQDEEL